MACPRRIAPTTTMGIAVFFLFFFVVIEAGPAVLRQAVCKLAGSCRNDEDGRQNR